MKTALDGIKVFDLTRVLAGPTCTQILGDLGADVIKVEQPGVGDVTRHWGPPFITDAHGQKTSAYYLCANRNKRSLTLDLSHPEGQKIAHDFIAQSDVVVENFLTGTAEKYTLGYDQLKERHPGLIYCSITGFGHTGPYAQRPGYDFQVQGMGGLMGLTGEPDGAPMRVGISVTDYTTGLYAAMAILATLVHREKTGQGQHIDMSLLDTQVAGLIFEGQGYLLTHQNPTRHGNAHPNIVPYGVFEAQDRPFIIAVGKDDQFARLATLLDRPDWQETHGKNAQRVADRVALTHALNTCLRTQPADHWIAALEKLAIPCGPINTLEDVFQNPQVQARGHQTQVGDLPILASPLRLGTTPPQYTQEPPALGEHTDALLHTRLNLSHKDRENLRTQGVI